jgi:putative lipase involved disintegration of autophagic bodies
MAFNAYRPQNSSNWIPVLDATVLDFGWNASGVRGYYFIFPDLPLVVISFKGTSVFSENGVSTVETDKNNVGSILKVTV